MNTFFFDDVQYPEGLFGGKDFFNPIIYSTEEREVGVWIDNKPLYEKTIKTTYTKGSSWTTITHNISDIENIVDCEAFVVDQGTMYEVPQYRNSSMYFVVGVNSSVVYYINTWLDSGGDISITLRYTKTTDVAGSGQYTTLGIPAVHYDGNEKVVGTWFGETLYEKTFDCGGLLNAQTKEISYTENMDTIIIVDAFAMSTNEGYVIPIPDVVPNYVAGSLRLYVNKTTKKICIYTQADMRTYDKSYVTLRYTKTS